MPIVPVRGANGETLCELDVPDDASVISPPEGSPFQRMIRCRMCRRWSWQPNELKKGPWSPDGQLGHQFTPWAEGTEWKPDGPYLLLSLTCKMLAVAVGAAHLWFCCVCVCVPSASSLSSSFLLCY